MSKLQEISDKLHQNAKETGTALHLFRVYMTVDFWHECMKEVHDSEKVGTALQADFYHRQVIDCVEVFVVDKYQRQRQLAEDRHPPYSIMRFV